MNTPKGNGPDAPHDRPAKTLTKHTADFIADKGFMVLCLVLLLQAVLLALLEVLV